MIVNNRPIAAYVDTGSKLNNMLSILRAKDLQLEIQSSTTVMKGFGGACVNLLCTCYLCVSIDNVELKGAVELTSCFTFDADLIIGQTMINSDNISLITSAASIRFVQKNAVQEIITDINLKSSDFNRKYPIYLKHSVNIPVVILCLL